MRQERKTRGKLTARDRQMALQRAQRKYLRGPIAAAEVRPADERKLDGLPDCAFVGEHVRSFVAVSSCFSIATLAHSRTTAVSLTHMKTSNCSFRGLVPQSC